HCRLDIGLRFSRRKGRPQESGGIAQLLDGDAQTMQLLLAEAGEMAAGALDLVMTFFEQVAAERVEPAAAGRQRLLDEGGELAVEVVVARSGQGGAGALEMRLGEPCGD